MRIPLLFIGEKSKGVNCTDITNFLHSFYTLCTECNLGWTKKNSHTMVKVSFGTMVKAQTEGNIFDSGMMGDQTSLPPPTLFLKIHSYNYTLPLLIKRRNRDVNF